MPVRKFFASTLNGALKAVKEAFGDQAVIISTRELDPSEWRPLSAGARAIEVVASDDPIAGAAQRYRRANGSEPVIEPEEAEGAPPVEPRAAEPASSSEPVPSHSESPAAPRYTL